MAVVQTSRRLHGRDDPRSVALSGTAGNGRAAGSDDAFAEHFDPHGHHHRPRAPPPPQSLARSRAVLEALSDESSKLARFLFVRNGESAENVDDGNNGATDDDESLPSMCDMEAAFLALALEPMRIRNERITRIFEAFAIFGALFMNGVWIIYEWGSSKGQYGGDDGAADAIAGRAFECVMALALVCNTFLAFFGAVCWLLSLFWNSSHEDYVFNSRRALVYLTNLLNVIPLLIVAGLLLGLYSNLAPHWPETAICLIVAAIVFAAGMRWISEFQLKTGPLECYHSPAWFRSMMYPQLSFSRRAREDLRARARVRASELRERAYRERKAPDPKDSRANDCNAGAARISPMGALLRKAATNLGRADGDVSAYEARLEKEWIGHPEQLKGVSVDSLTRYMPFGLAREVHKLLETISGEDF